jgi:hypothetical protein
MQALLSVGRWWLLTFRLFRLEELTFAAYFMIAPPVFSQQDSLERGRSELLREHKAWLECLNPGQQVFPLKGGRLDQLSSCFVDHHEGYGRACRCCGVI